MLRMYLLLLGLTAHASLVCVSPSKKSSQQSASAAAENQTARTSVSVSTQENEVDKLTTPQEKFTSVARAKGQLTEKDKKADLDYCKTVLSDPNADVNSVTPSGIPVLEFLSILYLNNLPVEGAMLQLLARGADVNVFSFNTKTPLYYLTCYTVCPEFFEKIQAEKSAKVTTEEDKDTTKATPTKEEKVAASKTEEPAAQELAMTLRDKETNLQVMELLLYFGANPLVGDENGVTPVHLALSKKDSDVLNLFVKYGWIQVVETDTEGVTLQEAAETREEQQATA